MGLVAVGDNVVDCYLDSGELYPGGNCVNVAVAARRAGTRSAYIGSIGTDAAGGVVLNALRDEGVDVTRVRVVDGANSFATVRHVDQDRFFGPNDIGVRVFQPNLDDLAYIAGFEIAHSSYCSHLESYLGDIAGHARVSFDFDDRVGSEYAEALLPHTWIAEFSAADLEGRDLEDAARWAHSRGPRYVLITRGPLGSMLFDGVAFHYQGTVAGDIVDTLGAGDAFIARTLTGLIAAEPIPALLGAAAAAAAQICSTWGGFGHGVPLPDDYPPGLVADSLEVPAPTTL